MIAMNEVLNLLDNIHASITAGTSLKSVALQKLELLQIISKNVPEEERSRRASILIEKLKSIIYDAKNDEELLLKLLNSCLLNLINSLYPQDDSDGLLEELLETISILVDCGSKVQALVVSSLSREYLGIITSANCLFGQKMEVLKSFNVLLESCPFSVKQELVHSKTFLEKMKLLFNLIFHIGDYEFQVGTLECIFRLVPRKIRPQYASKFIPNTELISAFLMIKDGNFETDCRLFLNCLNKQMNDKKRVLSVPCLKGVLGKRKLTKPDDPGYDDFWVDFNFGSKRITIFCEQDNSNVYSQQSTQFEDMWETISIWAGDVQSYQCSGLASRENMFGTCPVADKCLKNIYPPADPPGVSIPPVSEMFLRKYVGKLGTDSNRPIAAILVLKKNVKELFPHMVEAEGKELCLLFDEKWCVSEALRKTLGLKRQSLKKVSSVNEPLHLCMRNGSLQVNGLGKNSPYQDSTVSSQTGPCTTDTPVGKKISVPSVPMRTPARYATPEQIKSTGLVASLLHASNVTECVSSLKIVDGVSPKTNKSKSNANIHPDSISEHLARDFKSPRTPQDKMKPRHKVKTPVVTVGVPRIRVKISRPQNVIKIQNSKPAENQVMIEESLCLGQNMVEETVIPDSLPDVHFGQKDKTSRRKSVMDDSGIGLNESDLFSLSANHVEKQKKKTTTPTDKYLFENERLVPDISNTDQVQDKNSQKETNKRNRNRRKIQYSSSMTEKDNCSLTEKIAGCSNLLLHKENSMVSDALKVVQDESQQETIRSNMQKEKISFEQHKQNSSLAKCGNRKPDVIRNRISPDTTFLIDNSKSDLDNLPNETDPFVVNEFQDCISSFNNNKQTEVSCSEHCKKSERTDLQKSREKSKKKSLDNNMGKSISKSKTGTSDLQKKDINNLSENNKNKQNVKTCVKEKIQVDKTPCLMSPQIGPCKSRQMKGKDSCHQPVMLSRNYDETNISEISDAANLNVLKSASSPQISDILKAKKTKGNVSETINKSQSYSEISDNDSIENLQSNCKQMLKDPKIGQSTRVTLATRCSPCPEMSTKKLERLRSDNTKRSVHMLVKDADTLINENDTEIVIPSSSECNRKILQFDNTSEEINSRNKSDSTSVHNKTTSQIISSRNYFQKANEKVATCGKKTSKKGKKAGSQEFNSPTAAEVFTNKANKKQHDPSQKQNKKRKHKLYTSQIIESGQYKLTKAVPENSLARPFNSESDDSSRKDEMEIVTSEKDAGLLHEKQLSQIRLDEKQSVKSVTSPDSSTGANHSDILSKRPDQEEDQILLSEPRRVLRKKKQSNKSLYVFDSPRSSLSIEVTPNREKSKYTNKMDLAPCKPVKPIKTNNYVKKPVPRLLDPSVLNIHVEDNDGSDPYDFDAEIEKSSRCSGMKTWKLSKMPMQNSRVESKSFVASKCEKPMIKSRKKKAGKEQTSEVTIRLNKWESFSKGHNKSLNLSKENDLDNFEFSCTNSQMVQNSVSNESDISQELPFLESRKIELIKKTCSEYSIHQTKKTETKVEWIDHRLLDKSPHKHVQSVIKVMQGNHSTKPTLTSAQSSSIQERPENGSSKEMIYGTELQNESSDVLSNFSAVCKNLLMESSLKGSAECIQEDEIACGRSELSWITKTSAAKRKMKKVYQRNVNKKWKEIQNSLSMNKDDLIMSSQEWELTKESPAYRVKCNITQKSITPKLPSFKKKYSPLDVKVIQTPKTPKTPCSISWTDADDEEEAVSTGLDQCCDQLDNTSSKDCDDISIKFGSTNSKHSSLQNDLSSWKSILSSKIQSDMETQITNVLRSENNAETAVTKGVISGPSSTIRPSKSTLKRKYPEVDSFSEENEDELSPPAFQNTSQLIPRKLFRNESLKKPRRHESFSPRLAEKECIYKVLHKTRSPLSLADGETSTSDVAELDLTVQEPNDVTLQSGISAVIKTFGTDMQKQIIKQNNSHLEKVTSGALKSTQKHFSQLWMQQNQTRVKIMDDFKEKMIGELQALEKDITALKSAEDQAVVFFRSQLKVLENHKVSQKTSLTNIKLIHESLNEDLKVSEDNEKSLQNNFSNVLKKDIIELQKKLLLDSQKRQLANVRKCLLGVFS